MKLLFALTIAAIGFVQWNYFRHPVIKQRLVQVIEISANEPPKLYVISEPDNDSN